MQDEIKIESIVVPQFGYYRFFQNLERTDFELYCKCRNEYDKSIAQLPAPSLNWDDTKGYFDRLHEITTGTRFKLFSEIPKEEFMPHFLPGMLWKTPIIVVGQLNILASVLHEIVEKGIIRINKKMKFKLTAPHFATISSDPMEKYKPITAHDLSKALHQGLGPDAGDVVDEIMEYISKHHS